MQNNPHSNGNCLSPKYDLAFTIRANGETSPGAKEPGANEIWEEQESDKGVFKLKQQRTFGGGDNDSLTCINRIFRSLFKYTECIMISNILR